MQLVYFWVEDYKCLKDFEINLSSQYEIHYDKANNKLNVEETPERHQLFKNIASEYECINDLTAIVGKNGVGKTTILELLMDCINTGNIRIIIIYKQNEEFHVNKVGFEEEYGFGEDMFKKYPNINWVYGLSSILLGALEDKEDLQLIYFSNVIDKRDMVYEPYRPFNYNKYKQLLNISSNYLLNSFEKERFQYYIYKINDINNLCLYFKNNKISFLDCENLMFNLVVDSNIANSTSAQNDMEQYVFESNDNTIVQFNIGIISKLLCIQLISQMTNSQIEIYKKRYSKSTINDSLQASVEFINNIFDLYNYIEKNRETVNHDTKINIADIRIYALIINDLIIYLKNVTIEKDYKYYCFNANQSYELAEILRIEPKITSVLNLKCISLSSGEEAMLNMYSRFYSLIYDEKIKEENKEITILIDECDAYLHPEWQRSFMKDFFQMCQDLFPKKKINVILTTHSPIVLSDIPKDNVRFLDKDKDGKVTVCREKIDTFGANIYNLYKNAFFLNSDGSTIMGSLATEKINWVKESISILKNKAYSNCKFDEKDNNILKSCSEIVSLIGEDIIKNYLQSEIDYINEKIHKAFVNDNLDELKQKYYNLDSEQKEDFIKYIIDINNNYN